MLDEHRMLFIKIRIKESKSILGPWFVWIFTYIYLLQIVKHLSTEARTWYRCKQFQKCVRNTQDVSQDGLASKRITPRYFSKTKTRPWSLNFRDQESETSKPLWYSKKMWDPLLPGPLSLPILTRISPLQSVVFPIPYVTGVSPVFSLALRKR